MAAAAAAATDDDDDMGLDDTDAAAADANVGGTTTTAETWTVSVWTDPGKEVEDGAPPLWERRLVTPNIKLVRGGDLEGISRGGGAGGPPGDGAADYPAANAHVDANANTSSFDASAYFASLRTRRDGRVALLTAKELPSTQNLVQENTPSAAATAAAAAAAALPPGVVCVADLQVNGRGRGGNVWTSPPGCLMFSLLTTHKEGRTLPFLQYIATMAAVEAIQEAADVAMAEASRPGSGFRRGTGRTVDVRIKWPNDLYSGGLKIGGVLCTSTYSNGAFDVIVGVGINLDNAEPTTCVNRIIEERLVREGLPPPPQSSPPLTRERLLAGFMNRFEALCGLLAAGGGFAPLEESYLRQWLHTDQEVSLVEVKQEKGVGDETGSGGGGDGGSGSGGVEKLVKLVVKGVTSTGYLLAVDAEGERYELHPDGNSLDFFKGLVRKKLPRR